MIDNDYSVMSQSIVHSDNQPFGQRDGIPSIQS